MRSILDKLRYFPFSSRQRRAMQGRAGFERDAFVEDIASGAFEREIAEELWDHLMEFVCVDAFQPHPDDELGYVYGIDEEELDEDLLLKLLTDHGIPIPSAEQVRPFGPVSTPRKAVKFLSACRRLGMDPALRHWMRRMTETALKSKGGTSWNCGQVI